MESETINTIANNGSRIGELFIAGGGSYAAGLEMLIVSLAIVLVLGLSIMFFLSKRNMRELEKTQVLCTSLRNDLQIAASCAIGMGQRIIFLEQQINGRVSDAKSQIATRDLKTNIDSKKQTTDIFSETFKTKISEQKASAPKLQAVHVNETERQSYLNSFDKAGELLKNGMSEEEVAKRCELSSSETALMAMVMKQKSASA